MFHVQQLTLAIKERWVSTPTVLRTYVLFVLLQYAYERQHVLHSCMAGVDGVNLGMAKVCVQVHVQARVLRTGSYACLVRAM